MLKKKIRGFPGGPVVNTPCFQPGSMCSTGIPQAVLYGQKKKLKQIKF